MANSANIEHREIDSSVESAFSHYKVGQVYRKSDFYKAVKIEANRNGFEVAVRGKSVVCSRAKE